ncbi:HutD family protein [Nocardioides sp. R1-1]|uniref:HutD/Ves family protein n=1 Tax=Nocardioides sp. R1-1 TaxID=3383502 RepID=UPI0038D10CAD
MSTTITRAADLPRVPWRNGQGRTTEIARDGAGAEFTWRVSLAEVARSGDFSPFPGVDRIIALVEGDAMTLHLPDRTHVLRPDEPFAFDGGLPVRCEVDRPTRDLNVMTRRGAAAASLRVLRLAAGERPVVVPAADVVVLVVLDGTAELEAPDRPAGLRAGDAAVTDAAVRVSGAGRVAVATISGLPTSR